MPLSKVSKKHTARDVSTLDVSSLLQILVFGFNEGGTRTKGDHQLAVNTTTLFPALFSDHRELVHLDFVLDTWQVKDCLMADPTTRNISVLLCPTW